MRYIRIVWVIIVCSVVIYVVLPPVPDGGDERGIFFGYVMMLLTFPLGAALYTFVDGMTKALGITNPVLWSRLLLAALWVPLAAVGYFQWFVAVPWLLQKLRGRAHRRSSSSSAR
jgi:hypothetical protein